MRRVRRSRARTPEHGRTIKMHNRRVTAVVMNDGDVSLEWRRLMDDGDILVTRERLTLEAAEATAAVLAHVTAEHRRREAMEKGEGDG